MEERKKKYINSSDSKGKERGSKKLDKNEYIFGTRPVLEAIHAGKNIDKILVQKGSNNSMHKELIGEAHQHHIPVSKVPVEKLNGITQKNHQGVIGLMAAVPFASLDNIIAACYDEGKEPCVLLLDGITDVRNFGGIARSAACAGVDAIVIPQQGGVRISGDALKTSAGALNYISVCRSKNIYNTLSYLKEFGLQIMACTEKGSQKYYEADLTGPLALIMGSEEKGIAPATLKIVDREISIPMEGEIQSLNVSVATGIVLFEAKRQQALHQTKVQ